MIRHIDMLVIADSHCPFHRTRCLKLKGHRLRRKGGFKGNMRGIFFTQRSEMSCQRWKRQQQQDIEEAPGWVIE